MPYVSGSSLAEALERLKGTAEHMLNNWFTLKQMGMTESNPVRVNTASPADALNRLFSFGHPDGLFYFPFAHTARYMTAKSHASRSIIQTNIKRWQASGSVVGADPTNYLQI